MANNKFFFLFLVLFSGFGSAWYGSYANRYTIQCENCQDGRVIPVNDSGGGLYIDWQHNYLWTLWTNNATLWLYWNNASDYLIVKNGTTETQWFMGVEKGLGTSFSLSSMWASELNTLTNYMWWNSDNTISDLFGDWSLSKQGAPIRALTNSGYGIQCDGVDDFYEITSMDSPNNAGTYSIVTWFNYSKNPTGPGVWENDEGAANKQRGWRFDNIGRVNNYVSRGSAPNSYENDAGDNPENAPIKRYTATYDSGGTFRSWENATEIKASAGFAVVASGANTGHLCTWVTAGGFFNGTIDEFRYYRANLTLADIGNITLSTFKTLSALLPAPFGIALETYNLSGIEGTYQTFILDVKNASLAVNTTFYFNETAYTPETTVSGINYSFKNTLLLPNILSDTNVSFYWKFTVNGSTYTTTNRTFTIQNLLMYNCSPTSSNIVLRLFMVNETNLTAPIYNATVFINFNALTANTSSVVYINFNSSAQHNITVCSNNTNFDYMGDIDFIATGYVQRTYHIYNGYYNGTTTNMTLYFLSNSIATLFNFKVVDLLRSPIPGAYLYFKKEFPTTDTTTGLYQGIATARMSDTGIGFTYLQLDKFYKYDVVSSGNELLDVEDRRYLLQSNLETIEVQADTSPLSDYWTTIESSNYGCNSTWGTENKTVCGWSSGGEFLDACMYAYTIFNGTETLETSECSSALIGTLSKIYNNTSAIYKYVFVISDYDGPFIVKGGWYTFPQDYVYDSSIALIVVVMFLTLGVILGIPEYTTLLTGFVFLGATLLHLIPLGWDIGFLGFCLCVIASYILHEAVNNAT